jgi:hypothetical protein
MSDELVKVEQVDRDRLAARYRELSQPGMAEEIESGAMDDHPNLIMLARHRIAAEAKLAEAVEALQKIQQNCQANAFGSDHVICYICAEAAGEASVTLAKLEPET